MSMTSEYFCFEMKWPEIPGLDDCLFWYFKVSKKNKNVGHFLEKPAPQPNAVCFEILGSNQTHNEVKLQLERLLKTCPEVCCSF